MVISDYIEKYVKGKPPWYLMRLGLKHLYLYGSESSISFLKMFPFVYLILGLIIKEFSQVYRVDDG